MISLRTYTGPTVTLLPQARLFAESTLPTPDGHFRICVFRDAASTVEHVALVLGAVEKATDVLLRIHSECLTGDAFGSTRCDCREQLLLSRQRIGRAGRGILIYLRQEGRGIGLGDKIRAYALQDKGLDTFAANRALGLPEDGREYGMAAAILERLGPRSVALMTNNPHKISALKALGVDVARRVSVGTEPTRFNRDYLNAKVRLDGHFIPGA